MKKSLELYMEPIVEMINSLLGEIFPVLKNFKKCDHAGLFSCLSYDGCEKNAEFLLSELLKNKNFFINSVAEKKYKKLVSLLPIISLIEEGGLDRVNLELENLLNSLRSKQISNQNNLVDAFNDLLFGAIYVFPHLAKTIEVVPNIKLIKERGDRAISDKSPAFLKSNLFDSFDRTYSSDKEEKWDSVFRVLLPLDLSLGGGSSLNILKGEIYMVSGLSFDEYKRRSILFSLVIHYPTLACERVFFTLDEILSVKFSKECCATPYFFGDSQDCCNGLGGVRDRKSPVLHYLDFRKFLDLEDSGVSISRSDGLSRDEIYILRDKMLKPLLNGRLWKIDRLRKRLILGFLVLKTENGCCRLYEISNHQFSEHDFGGSSKEFMISIMREGDVMRDVKIYEEDDIIQRLLAIPVIK